MKMRDCLAKMLYNRLFEMIISTVNDAFALGSPFQIIGILDIAGFGEFIVHLTNLSNPNIYL